MYKNVILKSLLISVSILLSLGLISCTKKELTDIEYYSLALKYYESGNYELSQEKIDECLATKKLSKSDIEKFDKLSKSILISKNAKSAIELAEKAFLEEEYESALTLYGNVVPDYEDYAKVEERVNEIKEIMKNIPVTKREQREIEKKNIQDKAKDEQAVKKMQGVTIGMTMQDVRDSSWGEPYEINRTTTQDNIREQWCYHGSRYLYFENGKLVAIQE